MLLIYTTVVSKRLNYIIKTLFADRAKLTTNEAEWMAYEGFRINYSDRHFSSTIAFFTIEPQSLLFEEDIHQQHFVYSEWEGMVVFFQTKQGDLPFDIFAAAFYLIARYEEYLPFEADEYGRFPHEAGMAFQQGFLKIPLVQYWVKKLLEKLAAFQYNHSLTAFQNSITNTGATSSFKFIPSYDIDVAYCYQEQPLLKNLFGFFKCLFQARFNDFIERANVFSGIQADPYDQYAWLDQLHQELKLSPIYFFLLAKKRKGVDKNISPSKKGLQQLIQQHAKKYIVGIHPSWQSSNDEKILQEERNCMEKIIRFSLFNTAEDYITIAHSRQHYLRMNLPDTYQRLMGAGIQHDYTMGYGAINGFRASYAAPFKWYDLSNDQATDIVIHPFCFMDTTAIFQQRMPVYDAMQELQFMYNSVKSVGGDMMCIFHNQYLSNQLEWKEWKNAYEKFLRNNA